MSPVERLEVLLDKVAELTGQRNAIDGQIVEIVAEIDHDGLWGATGARSVPSLVAWMTGVSPRNAETVVAIAQRIEEFPRCAKGMREGRFSLDQVGVIAENAADGSDAHYAEMAAYSTVNQLRSAIKLVCPYHHRAHHRGVITITGPAQHLVVTDQQGRPLKAGSLARLPTTPPPAVKPCAGPTGERADWWWYQPFQPLPPPTPN
ncbi:hypothetical protein HNP02_003316 [Mycobacterium sp. AZCC_0083]|nr:hypothetical protein [Mycobacterium sp. AZCC_0083]